MVWCLVQVACLGSAMFLNTYCLSSNHFYQNGTDRNAIVTVVIYAILTMFKWCHIDSSLFCIFPPLVMPYASNACMVILFYVICIDSMGFYTDGYLPILLM